MKPGSLVQCIEDIPAFPPFLVSNRPSPNKGDIETVDYINECGGLVLEGFHIKAAPGLDFIVTEIGFDPAFWREVQPPVDLSFVHELQAEKALAY